LILSLLEKRRSVRKFSSRPVEGEKTDKILQAMLRSPSSRGLNPWEFVLVTEREPLEELSRAKEHGSAFLAGVPLAIVVCADPERSDVWTEDCAIVSIMAQLQAQAMGLGSCWVQIRQRMKGDGRTAREHVLQTLGIPSRLEVLAIIGIGYPADQMEGHPAESLSLEKVHRERYGRVSAD